MLLAQKNTSGISVRTGGTKPSSFKPQQIIRIVRPGGQGCAGAHLKPVHDAEDASEEENSHATSLLEKKPRVWRESDRNYPWKSESSQPNWYDQAKRSHPDLPKAGHPRDK